MLAHLRSSLPSQMPLHVHVFSGRRHGQALALVAFHWIEISLDARDRADVAYKAAGQAPQAEPMAESCGFEVVLKDRRSAND